MKRILLVTLITFLAVTNFYAKKPGRAKDFDMPMMSGFGLNWLEKIDELKLTDEQLEKIRKLKVDTEKEIISLGAELRKSEIDLREKLISDNIDENDVKNLIKKINEYRGKIFEKLTLARIESWKLLTPDQKKIAKSYLLRSRKEFKQLPPGHPEPHPGHPQD